MVRILFVVILLAFSTPTFAQQSEPAPLTEVERLKLENVVLLIQVQQLKVALAEAQIKLAAIELDQITTKVVGEIEATRPGFTYEPETGTFKPKVGEKKPQ